MKKLRNFTVASLLVLGANFSIMAQKAVPAVDHQGKGQPKITEILTDLTDAQKAKISEVEKSYEAKIKEARSEKMATEDERMKKIKMLRQEKRKAIEAILTDKQKETLKAYRQEHKDVKKVEQAREERAEDLVNKLDEQVKLTSEQRVKALEIAKKFIAEKNAIKSNTSLTEEEKEAQIRVLKKTQKAEMHKMLTPEQNEILKAKMEEKKSSKK